MQQILIDGKWDNPALAWDRGLFYGDGLFETMTLTEEGLPLWDLHKARLLEGCERLGLPAPDERTLDAELVSVIEAGTAPAVIKLIYTRGNAARGYQPPPDAKPRRLFYRLAWPSPPSAHWEDGIVVRLCKMRLAEQPRFAGLKTLNRLEQVMARAEWHDASIQEGIMCSRRGDVIEGTMSNVFVVNKGSLSTPVLDQCGIAGVMRRKVMNVSEQLGLVCEQTQLSVDDLAQADEIFMTNSLIGIWPVRRFEQTRYRPGAITRKLQTAIAPFLPSHEIISD